jgi:hypothetical protein
VVVGGQAALDFEVAARAQSMADVADFREQTLLAERPGPTGASPVVAPGRTIGASSRLLYDILGHVYDWLGFDAVGDAVFRDLVIARIVEPTSKLDASRVLADLGARACQVFCVSRLFGFLSIVGVTDTARCGLGRPARVVRVPSSSW